MATVVLEGQRLEIADEIARDDEKLRAALAQFFPEAANATFHRQDKEGQLTVTVFKRAGTKGSQPVLVEGQAQGEVATGLMGVLGLLVQTPEEIHPARRLAWELEERRLAGTLSVGYLLTCQTQLVEAEKTAATELETLGQLLQALKKARPVPAGDLAEVFL